MSLISKKEANIQEKQKVGEEIEWYRVYPDIYRQIDYKAKQVNIEVNLPGVKKEDIMLKALPTWFHIEAKRTTDNVVYSADPNFGTEIVPTKTTAKYNNGLLSIKAYIRDPLESSKEVEIK